MHATVKIKASKGPHSGEEFAFESHDMFIFGRSGDCQCSIPDDPYISSSHFLLEINPPDCELRDLGSKNGTFVNGARCGGREKGEDPGEAAARMKPFKLKHGDLIKAGQTEFLVAVQTFKECEGCGKEVFVGPSQAAAEGLFLCEKCGPKVAAPSAVRAPEKAAEEGKKKGYFTDFLAGIVKPAEEEKPPEFPGYKVEGELAEGGMGRVFLAKREDGRPVVLKVVKPYGRRIAEREAKVFRREMKVAMELRHPNIVEFYEEGFADGMFFFAMEFCDKGSAAELMGRRGGKLDLEEAGDIMLQALEGLAYAHSKGIVHRDLKPHNILLSDSREGLRAKIADFGLAKNFALAGLSGMTASGQGGGTLAFMPKEQLKDYRGTKPVSDVFSMGAAFYYMLTNEFVYDLDSVADPCVAVMRDKLIPIKKRKPGLPAEAVAVIGKALEPDFRERYPTAGEFKAALARALKA
ncbi:MAG: protein kinase [Elusimicrobia bacterium]|nr:protein kinase [Elusimicrobiota bacterium]